MSYTKFYFMKLKLLTISFFACGLMGISAQAQGNSSEDSTGLPGDNFSLQGALAMFKKAGSPEEFEKMINSPDNHVNNLDLNGDGDIDYVRVIDKSKGGDHVFVLQVPVSENESQDIAVIELEKNGAESASLQIVGDEDIYGEQTIAEPSEDIETEPGGNGPYYNPDNYSFAPSGAVVNVWFWPCVRFVYTPSYTLWVSPWRWHRYPMWWHPWRPLAWHVFHPFVRPFHRNYIVVSTHRLIRARAIYTPFRTTSVVVRTRNQGAINHFRVSRTTTISTGPGGKIKSKKTVIRGRRKG